MESNDGDPASSAVVDRGSPPPPGVGTILNLMQPQQPYEVEDDHSGSGVLRDYNGVFEGPEKTLGEWRHDETRAGERLRVASFDASHQLLSSHSVFL
jgi:hypothetical protein